MAPVQFSKLLSFAETDHKHIPLMFSLLARAARSLSTRSSRSFSVASSSKVAMVLVGVASTSRYAHFVCTKWPLKTCAKSRYWFLAIQVSADGVHRCLNFVVYVLYPGVGKTSLVHLLCKGEALTSNSYTIGCNVEVKVLHSCQ